MSIQIFKNNVSTPLLTGVLQLATGTALNDTLKNITDQDNTNSPLQLSTKKAAVLMPNMIETTGTFTGFDLTRNITNTAGNSNYRQLNNTYTINNSGAQTGTITGIFLNATETALNGMTHNLMDLQVGGVSRFRVNSSGSLILNGGLYTASQVGRIGFSFVTFQADGIILLSNASENSFNRLQLGGTTSSFPAIKRNGAAIDFRLADDSAFCDITASQIKTGAAIFNSNTLYVSNGGGLYLGYGGGGGNLNLYPNSGTTAGAVLYTTGLMVGSAVINASAKLQVESTTQGFLPPRMTTAEINLIATPAEGLQVYNTTINHMCFYMNGAWVRINHSPM